MSERKGLVLDANILLRAVLGRRVGEILETYEDQARFYTPDVRFQDAQRYLPVLSNERGLDVDLGLSVLNQIGRLVEQVDRSLYEEHQIAARGRIALRDPDDCPLSLPLCCLNCRFGRRTRISLAVVSQPGRVIE